MLHENRMNSPHYDHHIFPVVQTRESKAAVGFDLRLPNELSGQKRQHLHPQPVVWPRRRLHGAQNFSGILVGYPSETKEYTERHAGLVHLQVLFVAGETCRSTAAGSPGSARK